MLTDRHDVLKDKLLHIKEMYDVRLDKMSLITYKMPALRLDIRLPTEEIHDVLLDEKAPHQRNTKC